MKKKTIIRGIASALALFMGIGDALAVDPRETWFEGVPDQALRENLTEFTQRCFYVPYVLMNVADRKKNALEAKSVIAFVKERPHPGLGIYWWYEKGTRTYLSCKVAASALETRLKDLSTEDQIKAERGFKKAQNRKREGEKA